MDVRTVKKGDRVLAPFAFSDGNCEYCGKGLFTSCTHGGFWGGDNPGGQAEAICAGVETGKTVAVVGDGAQLGDRDAQTGGLLVRDWRFAAASASGHNRNLR